MPPDRIEIPMRWDIAKMFAMSSGEGPGTPNSMHALLARHFEDHIPELSAIRMWKWRASIPPHWLAVVVYALMKEGHRTFEMMLRAP